MSHNKESKEVDFTIGELKMTEADRIAISQAIQAHKAKAAKKAARKQAVAPKKPANG